MRGNRRSVWKCLVLATLFVARLAGAEDIATGLSGVVGMTADPDGNAVYFVETGSDTLKRVATTPGCTLATCVPAIVASGFSNPQDVALDLTQNVAYVTTLDDGGTSGALWRVNLTTGVKSLVTFNLNKPQQLSLDPATNSAYIVASDPGQLWHVQLTTGFKSEIIKDLNDPVGLVVTADRTRAYVAETSPAQLVEIEIATGTRIRNISGITAPFRLEWTDVSNTAVFVAQGGAADNVVRVELATSEIIPAMPRTPAPVPPWNDPVATAVDLVAGIVYVAMPSRIVRVNRDTLPEDVAFQYVGLIASTDIDADGYASSPDNKQIAVVDAPFGGTLDLVGNLTKFLENKATHYRVLVSHNGGQFVPLMQSWNTQRLSLASKRYEPTPVAPVAKHQDFETTDLYEIPAQPTKWRPIHLMMVWPSGANGKYEFRVEIYKKTGSKFDPVALEKNTLTLRVDNDRPVVDLAGIFQQIGAGKQLKPCNIVNDGANSFDMRITASDVNGHMAGYRVIAMWGDNGAEVVTSDNYSNHDDEDGKHLWTGISSERKPTTGWSAKCNCAHTFHLSGSKRTTNGYQKQIYSGSSHESITIQNTNTPCPGAS